MSKEVFNQLLSKIEAMTKDQKVELLRDLLDSLINGSDASVDAETPEVEKVEKVIKKESAVIQ